MMRFVIAILVLVSVSQMLVRADDEATKDMKALKGGWLVIEAHQNGKVIPEEQRRKSGFCLFGMGIKDGYYQLALWKNKDSSSYYMFDTPRRFELEANGSPKVVAFDFIVGRYYAIYSIKDDKLTICFNVANLGDRKKVPVKLETKEGDTNYMIVFKRPKQSNE